MPDPPQVRLFQMPEPAPRHLRIPAEPNPLDFAGQRGRGLPLRDVQRAQHSTARRQQLAAIEVELSEIQRERVIQNLPNEVDLVLELESAPGFPLSGDQIRALATGNITLLVARPVTDEDGFEITRIALHVPYGSLPDLAEKVRRYGEDTTDQGGTPHSWMANVHRIAIAALEALWTDPETLPLDSAQYWWELWVRREPDVVAAFETLAEQLQIQLKGPPLHLPEHVIYVAKASRAILESSLDLLNTLREVRRARPYNLELSDLSGSEQHEWIAEALERMDFPASDAPRVCVLDSGINRAHPLLSPLLSEEDNHTVFPDGDRSDSWGGSGHGTPMAGVAAYGDLRVLLLLRDRWKQTHRLEGVKIIHPSQPHEPDNYGAITRQGIVLPEATAPARPRVYVMAITANGPGDGQPTSWSAAVDAAAYGSEEQGDPKRLILVSAGNVDVFGLGTAFEYDSDNKKSPIQDPAQAWNAITVGAITHFAEIRENDPESRLLQPVAPPGALSPFSCTGNSWDTHWPIKPEIVMEGGNAGLHPQLGPERRDSLDILSTSASVQQRPISPMRATSPATALAGRLAGELYALYPSYWPETIRGLIVHSARWSTVMLDGIDLHRSYSQTERVRLISMLRTFGFGEPDVKRARYSSEQAVTLFREDSITPYKGTAGNASLNECHIHRLRLPVELLRQRGDITCTMRVTLSYFTAPNPSASNLISGSRYRYGGSLLRFRVRHKDETDINFERKLSGEAAETEDENDDNDIENLYDHSWALGAKLRGKGGSIIQDMWQGSAADLAQMDRIGVFPAKGWWASRSFPVGSPWHRCHLRPIRYSLIVSIEASADIPIYTEIKNLLEIPVDIET